MVQKYLDLSTGHVSQATAEWIDSTDIIKYDIAQKGEYGWFVHISEEFPDDIPHDLMTVINYAKALDCVWIMFDADGDIINELPFFEW